MAASVYHVKEVENRIFRQNRIFRHIFLYQELMLAK